MQTIKLTPAGAASIGLRPEDLIAVVLSAACHKLHGRYCYLDELARAPIEAKLWIADGRNAVLVGESINHALLELLGDWPNSASQDAPRIAPATSDDR